MIMAGRGRRLEVGDKSKIIGTPHTTAVDGLPDLSILEEKINEINLADLNFTALSSIRNLFSQLCSSKETMRDLLGNLHDKALAETAFCEKLVVTLEQVSNLEVNGALLRGELLTLIQNDFEVKETMYKNEPKKFMNAVMLLGGVYNRIKVCGAPIAVLGIALLDYLDLLITGEGEELKVVAKQILINGKTLAEVPSYEQFQNKLRGILINASSSHLSKCWILLIIDLIFNDFRPLKGSLNEFYVSNLKDDYIKLESLIPVISNKLNHSPQSVKSSDSTSPRGQKFDSDSHNPGNVKKSLTKKFSDMTVKTEESSFKGKKDKSQTSPGKSHKRDNWKQNLGREASMSGHDDRFIKDENYYGVQMPRQPKPESRKFANDKSKKKALSESKTSPSKTEDCSST